MMCGNKATVDAFFQLQDYLVLRRYCEQCLVEAEYEECSENRDLELTPKQEVAPIGLAISDI